MLSSSKTSQNDNLEERRQKPLLWTFHHMIRKFSINLVLRNFYCITELVGRQENPKDPQTHIHGSWGKKKSHPPAEKISIQAILSHIYISFSLYLLTSVTHLKCHRDQNRAAFWWNSWQSYTRYKTRGLCLLIHHTINFSSIFYVQRATLSGKKIKIKNKKTR